MLAADAGVVAEESPVDVSVLIRALTFEALPADVVVQAKRCLLDLVGVAAAGTRTRLSEIARSYAATHLCSRDRQARILFDGRRSSIAGAAFAGASTIDAFDAHDGHVLTKGHAGVAILPALVALTDGKDEAAREVESPEFLASLVLGYEIATRAGIALHATVADYHCSGAWNALGCAAIASRAWRFDAAMTREALGIAEYFGPRGQMLRTCERPSMVKDGSGWGAHAGITAACLAREGFTGAPAAIVERDDVRAAWMDLGTRWRIGEQYFKAYPVCRWAQPAVEAVLALQRAHGFAAADVTYVGIETFREAVLLGAGCMTPRTTEDAQYSLCYPIAAALVFGGIGAAEIAEPALFDPRIQRLLDTVTVMEDERFSSLFPAERWARACIHLRDGRRLHSEPARARGNPENPLADDELRAKYRALASPVLGESRARRIEALVDALPDGRALPALLEQLLEPIR
jgi:2-methylcitrate dehydratase PrpD